MRPAVSRPCRKPKAKGDSVPKLTENQADKLLRQLRSGEELEILQPRVPTRWVIRKQTSRTYQLFTRAVPSLARCIQRWEARRMVMSGRWPHGRAHLRRFGG